MLRGTTYTFDCCGQHMLAFLQIDGTGTFGVVWGSFGPIFVKFSWCSLLGSIWGVKYSQIFATGEANICWVQRSKGYDIVPFQKLVKNTKTAISLLQIKIFEQFFFKLISTTQGREWRHFCCTGTMGRYLYCQYRVLPRPPTVGKLSEPLEPKLSNIRYLFYGLYT